MLRKKIYKEIVEAIDKGIKSKAELSVIIYNVLDDEGLSVYDNGWADIPTDLERHISLESDKELMKSIIKILIMLDDLGLGLSGNGWFDGDDEINDWIKNQTEDF